MGYSSWGCTETDRTEKAGTEAKPSWRDAFILCLINQFFRCMCSYIWIECLLFSLFFLSQTMNPCSDDLYWEKFGDCTISSFCFFAKFSWYLFHTENRIIFQNKMRIVDSPIYPYTLFSPNIAWILDNLFKKIEQIWKKKIKEITF